jgi:dienelactone hydrolase
VKSLCLSLLIFTIGIQTSGAAIINKTIDYQVNGVVLKGYLAYDNAIKGKRPGILVVHEWWGLNDYARKRARMLAKLGYTAFALDMYGDGKQATHPDDAKMFASEVMKNLPLEKARFNAGLEILHKEKTVDPHHIAAIGYCFGGGVVLQMARSGVDIAGVASFHGMLATNEPAQSGTVKAKILVMTGADDPFVPPDQVAKFKNEMDAAKVDYKVISYPGAKHSFTNPDSDKYGKKFNLPLAYNKDADWASWQEMQKFFHHIFNNK